MTCLELIDTKAVGESPLSKYLGKKRSFKHFNAKTIDEAISLLSDFIGEARIIAGGVDLVSLIKNGMVKPQLLVNIKTIPDLDYIREDVEGLKIGTLTTINEIKRSATIREKYTMLAEAAHSVAAPHVRNMATIGGNLCQEVRCWYYRRSPVTGRSFFCYRKGGEHCYAVAGENAYHSIFNGNECHAVCPSDLAPALIALEARVKIASKLGNRIVSLEDFYLPMGNILKPDEIITEIQVPEPMSSSKQRYLKFRLRKAIDFAISSVAAVTTTEAGIVTNARIVLGGVSPAPYRATLAEEVLKGEILTEDVVEAAARKSVIEAIPLSKNAYKLPITKALVKRAIAG